MGQHLVLGEDSKEFPSPGCKPQRTGPGTHPPRANEGPNRQAAVCTLVNSSLAVPLRLPFSLWNPLVLFYQFVPKNARDVAEEADTICWIIGVTTPDLLPRC